MNPRVAPTAVVLSIGEELLEGRIQDTNAKTFAAMLLQEGFQVKALHTIGDHPGALRVLLHQLQGKADVILSTGGLGPTVDDRVRAEVASFLRVPLKPVAEAMPRLQEVYQRFHAGPPPDFFLSQGSIPAGSLPLANAVGTAWGFVAPLGEGTRLYVLPGPPRECQATFFGGGGLEDLRAHFGGRGQRLAHAVLRTIGAAESQIEEPLRPYLAAGANPRVGITASVDGVSLSLLAHAEEDGRSAEEVLESCVKELQTRLAPFYWGRDDQSLAGVVVSALRSRGQQISCAESCTGGLLAAAITEVPGASAVMRQSWVTYADEAKEKLLGVSPELLESHGAVSAEVALAMAQGARQRSASDWALAVTGIAGPSGGREGKPVGTVFFALLGPGVEWVHRRQQYARGGRSFVRRQSTHHALDLLRRALAGLPMV